MNKTEMALKKKKETQLECFAEKCGLFELVIVDTTLKYLPKKKHIYQATCGTCKKVISVKASELLSFERVFGAYEIVIMKSTYDELFNDQEK